MLVLPFVPLALFVWFFSSSCLVCVDQIQVWDTAGQERFRTITQSYYRSAHGAIIAYDITRQTTFDSVSYWIKEVELYGASNVVLVLIGEISLLLKHYTVFFPSASNSRLCRHLGNKCDLDHKREVAFEEACNLARNRGMLAALETSAKVIRVHPSPGRERESESELVSDLLLCCVHR